MHAIHEPAAQRVKPHTSANGLAVDSGHAPTHAGDCGGGGGRDFGGRDVGGRDVTLHLPARCIATRKVEMMQHGSNGSTGEGIDMHFWQVSSKLVLSLS